MDEKKKIVVIGGGTGSFTVLSALKSHGYDLTAIVNMADDGGSTGQLRDELGVLPPGDVRQCLVALSRSPKLRDLFNYRFEEGTLKGHSFGNLFLTALEKSTGNFAEAIEETSRILRVNGRVIPVTLDNVRLHMAWKDHDVTLSHESSIDVGEFEHDPREAELRLEPEAGANPHAIAAIEDADMIVISPGDIYTSLGPLLVVDGIGQALDETSAKVVYIANLVTKLGQTHGFSVQDHARELERFAGRRVIDEIIYNTTQPADDVRQKYEQEERSFIVQPDETDDYVLHGYDLLGEMAQANQADMLASSRSLIRHDLIRLGKSISKIL